MTEEKAKINCILTFYLSFYLTFMDNSIFDCKYSLTFPLFYMKKEFMTIITEPKSKKFFQT